MKSPAISTASGLQRIDLIDDRVEPARRHVGADDVDIRYEQDADRRGSLRPIAHLQLRLAHDGWAGRRPITKSD
jgi:hypothetical protein